MNDPFQDFDETRSSSPVTDQVQEQPQKQSQGQSHGQSQDQGNRSYAEEIASEKIMAKYRTFFLDLKQSINGKFIKITEKNHGRRNTIMLDAEDLPAFMESLKKLQEQL